MSLKFILIIFKKNDLLFYSLMAFSLLMMNFCMNYLLLMSSAPFLCLYSEQKQVTSSHSLRCFMMDNEEKLNFSLNWFLISFTYSIILQISSLSA